jgi:hypothetical protein
MPRHSRKDKLMKRRHSTYRHPHPFNSNFWFHQLVLGHIEGRRQYYPTLIKTKAFHGIHVPVKTFPTLLKK